MSKPATIKLTEHERVVSVVPEFCCGPGWANQPLWVHIEDRTTKRLRTECIQPTEQTKDMHLLFRALECLHSQMLAAVKAQCKTAKGTTP